MIDILIGTIISVGLLLGLGLELGSLEQIPGWFCFALGAVCTAAASAIRNTLSL